MKRYLIVSLLFISLLLVIAVLIIMNMRKTSTGFTIRTSTETVIKEIRALNRLETASFTIEKVIDAGTSGNTFQEFLYGDRILLIAHGKAIAGFDLSQLPNNAIEVQNGTVTLTLPQPEILTTTIDNDQTRVYDRRRGLLNKGDKDLESKARMVAIEEIKKASCMGGILDEASANAKKQLTALLKALKFTTVTIIIPQVSC